MKALSSTCVPSTLARRNLPLGRSNLGHGNRGSRIQTRGRLVILQTSSIFWWIKRIHLPFGSTNKLITLSWFANPAVVVPQVKKTEETVFLRIEIYENICASWLVIGCSISVRCDLACEQPHDCQVAFDLDACPKNKKRMERKRSANDNAFTEIRRKCQELCFFDPCGAEGSTTLTSDPSQPRKTQHPHSLKMDLGC